MSGIAGSHASSLAPAVPGTEEQGQAQAIQANAQPLNLDVQMPQVSSAQTPQDSPQTEQQKPSLDDIIARAKQQQEASKPSLDDIIAKAKAQPDAEHHWYDVSLKGLGQATANAMPLVGQMAGSAVGMAGGPAGMLAGGGAGKAAGESLKQTAQSLMGSSEAPKSSSEAQQRIGQAAVSGVSEQAVGGIAGEAISKIPDVLTFAAAKTSGVSKWGIKTYAKVGNQIDALIDKYGPEMAGASDAFKEKLQSSIDSAKDVLNKQISNTLKTVQEKVSVQPLIDELDTITKNASGVQKQMAPEELQELQMLRDKLVPSKTNHMVGEDGMMSVQDMNQLKQTFQKNASDVYKAQNQGLSTPGKADFYAKANAALGAKARSAVDTVASDVTEANEKLQEFYHLDEKFSASLLNPKTSDAAIVSAGRGASPKTAGDLQELGKLTGVDHLDEAKIYAAAKDLSGSKAGWTAAGIKAAINAGRVPAPLIKALGGPEVVDKIINTPYGKAYLGQAVERSFNAVVSPQK